jgi:hypothetical protein
MARFQDIPTFTRNAGYMVHVGLDYLARHYSRYVIEYGMDVSPDFQRGYVWKPEQKVRFMEYMLRGGSSGLDIYINSPTWNQGNLGPDYPEAWCVLVDGKQRLDAALGFLNNEFPVFGVPGSVGPSRPGNYYRDFMDSPRMTQSNFRWHVNDLGTRAECLQWYLDLNSGGTVHTEDELSKVRGLIAEAGPYTRPTHEVILEQAKINRPIFDEVKREMAEEKERIAKAQAERLANPPKPTKKRSKGK